MLHHRIHTHEIRYMFLNFKIGSSFLSDKEAPKTSDCPLAIYETTTTTTKDVTWTPPTFTDNVGVKSVSTSGRKPGDTFDIGSTNVHYTALDDSNNKATCSFTVHLKSKCITLFSWYTLLVYTTQVNSTFRARWLASLEVIDQVLFTSEQPKENKMAFVAIFSQIKLPFGRLIIQLMWYILKQLFTSVSVKVVDIYLHFGE